MNCISLYYYFSFSNLETAAPEQQCTVAGMHMSTTSAVVKHYITYNSNRTTTITTTTSKKLPMTLTFDPLRATVGPTHVQTFKVNSQSVPKIEWKQTDGRTHRRTHGGDCITSHVNAVGNNNKVNVLCYCHECTLSYTNSLLNIGALPRKGRSRVRHPKSAHLAITLFHRWTKTRKS